MKIGVHWGVGRRLNVLVASALAGLALLLTTVLVSERNLLMQERQAGVRQAVEAAYGVIAHYHAQVGAGTMDTAAAQSAALETLRAMRYSGNEYFWVNDMQPRMVMHPIKPEMQGQDLRSVKDPDGVALFQAFADKVRAEGEGFVGYRWPKPGHAEPVPKQSFVKGFEPWGWIVGSGVYVDTVNEAAWKRAGELGLGVAVLAVLLLVLGVLVSRSILRQLGGEPAYASTVMSRMADGDLGVDIRLKDGDQGSLLHDIAAMRDAVARIVRQVHDGAEMVNSASGEIASGNQDLSARTESQASALQQTAASMEQLGATVSQNADNAQSANQLARHASEIATRGGEAVAQVVQTMRGIQEASRRMHDINAVIDGIAFQTNILALNAAVEAARAGEQGRGFAVVAAEVRSLAQRAASAAKEIEGLINTNVQRVEQGNAQVDQAGSTMTDVVTSIRRVSDIVAEISSANAQQSGAMSQVNEAVTQMDNATQQNAALVEQMAAAAAALSQQSHTLVDAVNEFRLGAVEHS